MRRQTGWNPPRRRWPGEQAIARARLARGLPVLLGLRGGGGRHQRRRDGRLRHRALLVVGDVCGGGLARSARRQRRCAPRSAARRPPTSRRPSSRRRACRRTTGAAAAVCAACRSARRCPTAAGRRRRRRRAAVLIIAEVVPVPVGSDDDEPTDTPTDAPAINSAGRGGGCPAWFSSEPQETDFFVASRSSSHSPRRLCAASEEWRTSAAARPVRAAWRLGGWTRWLLADATSSQETG